MNVGKYYVAGIPFDSENSLKHYGVKGMEWNKHKFGIDADDRYIKWLKNAGQNIGRFGANVAQNVAKGVTNAARTAGTAVNKGANFVTGNQNRQQYQNQSAAARMMRNPQQAQQRATNYYNQQQAKTLPGIAKTTVNTAKNTLSSTAQGVKNFAGQAAQNVGNAVGNFFSNRDEYQRLDDLSKHYDPNTGKWDSEENRKAFYDAQDAYNRHPATAIPDMARQIGSDVKNFVDYNITGEGQRRMADMLMQNPDQVNEIYENDGTGWKQVSQHTNAEAAERELSDAKNNTLFGRVGNAANAVGQAAQNVGNTVGQAAQNVGNAVSGAANKATEGAKGFLNSAGQWVSGAANNAKNTASKAASDAKKGASGFLNSAGQWVSNAAGNVKNAAQNVGNTVGQAAQNVGNTVGQAAEQARGGIGGFFDRVGNAVGGAAQNVGNWAGNAAKDVGGAVQNAGNWVGEQARNVGGAVTGAAQNVGNAVGQAAQNVGEFVTGRNANENLERLYEENITNGGNGMSPELAEARNRYNQTLPGMAERAMDNIREGVIPDVQEAVGNAGNWVSEQARNVGGAVTGAAQNVGNAARGFVGNVGNAVSGAADWARNVANNVGQAAQNAGQSIANIPQNVANWYTGQPNADRAEAIDRQVQEYERMGNMMYDNGLDNEGARYHQLAANLGRAADANQAKYDNAPRQQLSGLAGDIRNVVGTAGNAAGEWARNVGGNIGNWAGQAAQNVGQFLDNVRNSDTNGRIQLATQQMADNYSQYLQDHPENPQSPQHESWLRDQIRNDPQLRAFYEQYLNHSALNEKPDGVSDAFWEKFTADGGTREDYERDWR